MWTVRRLREFANNIPLEPGHPRFKSRETAEALRVELHRFYPTEHYVLVPDLREAAAPLVGIHDMLVVSGGMSALKLPQGDISDLNPAQRLMLLEFMSPRIRQMLVEYLVVADHQLAKRFANV